MTNMISEAELKHLIDEEDKYIPLDREDQTYHYGRSGVLREVLHGNNPYGRKYRIQEVKLRSSSQD